MVRVANCTDLPMGAVMLVGLPVILSSPRSIRVVPAALASGCGGAGGASGGVASAGGPGAAEGAAGACDGAAVMGTGCAMTTAVPPNISHPITSGAFMATDLDS